MNSSGQIIKIGQVLKLPGDDKCSECFCVGKNERLCRAVDCSVVSKCSSRAPDPDSCCGFICLQGTSTNNATQERKVHQKPEIETTTANYQQNSTIESHSVERGNRFDTESSSPTREFEQKEILYTANSISTLEPDSNLLQKNVNFSNQQNETAASSTVTEMIHLENETFSNHSVTDEFNTERNFQNVTDNENKRSTSVMVTDVPEIAEANTPNGKSYNLSDTNSFENVSVFEAINVSDTLKKSEGHEREISLELPPNETDFETTKSINDDVDETGFLKTIKAMNSAIKSFGNKSFSFQNVFVEGFKRSVSNAKNLIEEIVWKRNEDATTSEPSKVKIDDKIGVVDDNSQLHEIYLTSNLSNNGQMYANNHENYSSRAPGDITRVTNGYRNPQKNFSVSDNESTRFEKNMDETTEGYITEKGNGDFVASVPQQNDAKLEPGKVTIVTPFKNTENYSTRTTSSKSNASVDKFVTNDQIKVVQKNSNFVSTSSEMSVKPFEAPARKDFVIEDGDERAVIDLLQDMRKKMKLMINSTRRFQNVSLKFKNITNNLRHEIRKINAEVAEVTANRNNKSKSAVSIMDATNFLKNVSQNLKDHLELVKNLSKSDQKEKTFISKIIDDVKENLSENFVLFLFPQF